MTGSPILKFEQVRPECALIGQLILLDASSMVNREMASDLLGSGAPISTCGGPAQLPPVVGKRVFAIADSLVTEAQRQALKSPIVRQATLVRDGGRSRADGDKFRKVRRVTDSELVEADVALCFKNASRCVLNDRTRSLQGVSGCRGLASR